MKALATATLLALASGGAAAANRVDLGKLDLKSLKKQYATAVGLAGEPQMNHSRHELLLSLEQDSYLVMQSSNRNGQAVNRRYVQTFRGLPIFGENLVVSEDGQGNVTALFGRKIDGLSSEIASITPRLTSAQALAAAKKATLGKRTVVGNEKVELQIYVDDAGRAHLAYAVDFLADTPQQDSLSRPKVVVDANNGRILVQYENLQTDLIGTGPGGNEKIGQYEYGSNGKPYLDVTKSGTTCSMENADVKVIDANHTGNQQTGAFNYNVAAFSYNCPRNTFQTINGGYAPINDVVHNTGVVMKMYRDWTGAAPISGKLMSAVHYSTSWDNAAWNGTGMVYGDGSQLYPLVSLDVTSHEVSHGYTEQHSGLGPYYGSMAGCMNEAYSDMSGEAAEYFDRNGTVDWLVGAEISKAPRVALRYLDDPTKDGRSIADASKYNTSIDPHLCSGVYNKAFYTLATKAGWTVKTAWLAFQTANAQYWTSNATFTTGAQGVLKAACDKGYKGQDVIDAFNAVGVNAGALPAGCGGGNPPPNQAPVANFTKSVSGLTVTFTDSSTDSDGSIASRTWDFGDGTTSTQTSPSKTYTAAGTYTVKLTVTDNGGLTNTKTDTVTVTSGGGGGGSCSGTTYTGTLTAGGVAFQPNGTYYQSLVSGAHTGALTGPTGADFDLYLQKWNGFMWVDASKSEGPTNVENVNYNGTAGYYTWKVTSYTGSGSYTLCVTKP